MKNNTCHPNYLLKTRSPLTTWETFQQFANYVVLIYLMFILLKDKDFFGVNCTFGPHVLSTHENSPLFLKVQLFGPSIFTFVAILVPIHIFCTKSSHFWCQKVNFCPKSDMFSTNMKIGAQKVWLVKGGTVYVSDKIRGPRVQWHLFFSPRLPPSSLYFIGWIHYEVVFTLLLILGFGFCR